MKDSSSIFFPSSNQSTSLRAVSWSFWFMLAFLLVLAGAAYITIELDHPFRIATHSRALYVDEGFYSDAAQNFVKFGRWGFPYDFPHWAGAPLVTFLQSVTFSLFGPSLEAARLSSVALGIITALAFYSLLRMGVGPFVAALVTVSSILTFNYLAHARSALADPTAVCFSMLALLSYARIRIRELSIPASVGFAFLALLSKMYFVFTLGAIAGLWILELLLIPVCTRKEAQRKPLLVLGLSLAAAAALWAVFVYLFGERLSNYYAINANKIPFLDFAYLRDSFIGSLNALPYNTKAQVYLAVIPVSVVVCLLYLIRPRARAGLLDRVSRLTRAELAVGTWLLAGLLTIGFLQLHKPHYHFFAILPLCFVGVAVLKLALPARFHAGAICIVAAIHLFFQWQFYHQWMQSPQKTAIHDASREIVRLINDQDKDDMVPVIGEYSAQLGLFSDRIFSLDAKWSPSYPLCNRVMHWQPRFHVNVVWPGSVSQNEIRTLAACNGVEKTEEIARFPVFDPWNDEIVLSRIDYKN